MRSLRVSLSLLLALVLGVSVLSVAAACASAESYGELAHFGSAGTGTGQFKFTGPGTNGTKGTRAFGVDTSEDAVYVGDEPKAKEYRIQKLTAAGAFVAATPILKPPNRDGIEGIAFDPVLKRLYVLALEKHTTASGTEAVAGSLYAFSTEAEGAVLPPVSGTVEGVLTGPTTFKSQSEVPGEALIAPKGIAVDPTSHDVIVTGEIDEGEEERPFVLQRVDASTGALGERYVDRGIGLRRESEFNSPVVSAGGAVYVERLGEMGGESLAQIARVPSDFSSTQAPTPFISFIRKGLLESETNPAVVFANGAGGESLEGGGGLSLSAEASGEATIYANAGVFESTGSTSSSSYPGVLAFKDLGDSEGFELGWTGGQSRQTTESCAIGISGPVAQMVAGGAAGTVFVLDSKLSRIVELGPGGSGCPTAEAGELTASSGGAPVSGAIPAGTEVTLATSVSRANALSVEWSFGEGEAKPQTVSTDEYQHTQIKHTFEAGGELTVTETIHTDDLATPTIVRTTKISVNASHIPPTAVISGPIAIPTGQPGAFDGSASWDPNGLPGSSSITSYHWDFGDGATAISTTPEIEHVYAQTGVYAAKLTVVDGFGLESKPSEIDVTVNVPLPPAVESQPAGTTTLGLDGPLAPITTSTQTPATASKASPSSAVPDAGLAGTSLTVAANGTVALVVTCPSGASGCAGTVTLRTLGPVSTAARAGTSSKRSRKVVLTLAKGPFSIAGGRQQSLLLGLSPVARKLLAHAGTLRARAIVSAHDSAGTAHTTQKTVTLHAHGMRKKSEHESRAE
jgi:PKD repeat protein